MGLLIFFSNLPIPRAGGKPLSMEDVAVVRSATLIYLTAGCLRYFVANFVNAVSKAGRCQSAQSSFGFDAHGIWVLPCCGWNNISVFVHGP